MDRSVFHRLDTLEGEHWWFGARRTILGNVLRRLKRETSDARPRILEAGCGTGGNLKMLCGLGEVEAFEHDSAALEIARAKAPGVARFDQGTLPHGLPTGLARRRPYDLVVAFDVIEHVEEDRASLAALRGRLRHGGRLVMTVPAFPFLWSRHDETHHHFRRYTRAGLVERLEEAGYVVEHVTYYNSLLFPVVVAVRAMKKLLGLKDSADDAMPARGVNAFLRRTFAFERHWVGRWSVPFGVSLLAVARRP